MGFRECLKSLIVCPGNGLIVRKHGTSNLGEVAGVDIDLIVLNNSLLFDNLLNDIAPIAPFEVNGVGFENGLYLADGIYPQWATFVESFMVARDKKNALFIQRQKGARKDVERAFGVLKGRDFSVASVRKAIDDKLLPDVDSKTRWIKYVPIKVNVHA
ncbi:ALP1-like protein [Tanacetum coccineum]